MKTIPCAACKAPMIFAKVQRKSDGKIVTMPFDETPAPEGTWFLNENDDPLTARYVGKYDADYRKLSNAKLLHVPHHATCPDSKNFKAPYRGPRT